MTISQTGENTIRQAPRLHSEHTPFADGDSRLRFQREIVDRIGFIPTSTGETQRFLRGTYLNEAEEVLRTGYGIERRFGFAGNAVPLSRQEEPVIEEMLHTHRDAPVVLLFAFPNIRLEVTRLKNDARLPREFRSEIIAAEAVIDPTLVRSSGVTSEPNLLIEPQFIEGYYDKDSKTWFPNPLYWENQLKKQAAQEHWGDKEYQDHRANRLADLREKMIKRLDKEAEEYQKRKADEEGKTWLEWWAGNPNDEPEIRIP